MVQTVLVVAAHSDDEALGCAGTIARHTQNGDKVHLVFLTDGVGARRASDEGARARKAASQKAADLLGATSMTQFSLPDNMIDSVPLIEVVKLIESSTENLAPNIVYTHHGGDLNIDHRLCQQAVLTAFRPFPDQTVHSIYGFEVASSTEWAFTTPNPFLPSHYVDITKTLQTKLQVLKAYEEEMRPFPHVRSEEAVVALARWRGASVGCAAAEAFTPIRTIRR
ncbi:PIG-L deacetylase family protein [Sulfitobacter sp. 1A16787]|uniref:PIG-L deacetylase family protein n=1 Tax=Sulfitobacter sp. 1A16787 TaxID=3368571 RepID=UPI003746669D